MEKRNKFEIRILRFPINSDIGHCEEQLKYEVNQIWRDPRVRSVEIKTGHTDAYLIYDIISELF